MKAGIPFLSVHDEIIVKLTDRHQAESLFRRVLDNEFTFYKLNVKGTGEAEIWQVIERQLSKRLGTEVWMNPRQNFRSDTIRFDCFGSRLPDKLRAGYYTRSVLQCAEVERIAVIKQLTFDKMPKKGKINNPNGRPKGKPNRSTDELRSLLQNFIDTNMETLQADYDSLEPKDRLNFIERLLKHILPAPLQELEKLTDEQLDILIQKLKSNDTKNQN
jgi:hypothetical protein